MQSALFAETPEQIFLRVFSELKPRTQPPRIAVEFRPFANANSFIRIEEGSLRVRLSDVLQGVPAAVLEALAWILLSKLYRRPVPKAHMASYRRYLNRKEMRRTLQLLRQSRGRKLALPPAGRHYDLEAIFEELNAAYFHGLMARPLLGWTRRPSRTTLGHFDPSHNTIVINSVLDNPAIPRIALEFVLFHEMLHLRYPVDHRGARRCVHTAEFKLAEKQFQYWKEARDLLKRL
ncbi:MAG: SprT-like domain-containing protein [Acidobacteriota bacterium]|nr:SprT-like domain-containing protein [Acidobacteriota bacterium]